MTLLEKIKGEEDTRIACLFGFGVVIPVLSVLGFYAGTVINKKAHDTEPNWFWDMQTADLIAGFKGAGVGFAIAAIIAFYIVTRYPQTVYSDLEKESGHGHH